MSIKDFIAGGCGGLSLLAVGHPFDTIKVRVQTQPEIYGNAGNALKMTLAKEGPKGLYRGVAALVPGIAPVFALSFMGYGHGKQIFGTESTSGIMAAGFFSAFYTTALIGPGERIKCVAQTTDKYGKGALDVAKGLYKEGGARGILKGSGMTLARDGFGGAFYYGAYEILKQDYLKKHNLKESELPVTQTILFGGLGGMAMWITAMPIDNVKSRIQTAPEGVTSRQVMAQIAGEVKANGPKVVYRGLGVTLARAFPANAACFVGYEQSKKFLNKLF